MFLSDDIKAIYHCDYNMLRCGITAVQELQHVWLPHSNIAILINIWGAADQFNSPSHLIDSPLKMELLVSCMGHCLPPAGFIWMATCSILSVILMKRNAHHFCFEVHFKEGVQTLKKLCFAMEKEVIFFFYLFWSFVENI